MPAKNKHTSTTAQDYYPFGMPMPRLYGPANSTYRFGFNGKENDNEVKGFGNSLDFGARIYDPRIARWMSVEPLFKKYVNFSTYCISADNPIFYKDVDGRYFTGNTASVIAVYKIISILANENNRAKIFKEALEKMDASDVEFHIQNTLKPGVEVGRGTGGNTIFDVENNRIVFDIFKFRGGIEHAVSEEGRAAHEFAHGFQFLNGELDFINRNPGDFYDQGDEEKAFQIQHLIMNLQLKEDEKFKTDKDALKSAKNYKLNSAEKTISFDQAEGYKLIDNNKRIDKYNSIYNYKPTEKQQKEKRSILE